ncbi:uncharacterized protein LOC114716331 [Neltuma alba]|uniref:uncharacterized protein LOC114716331 n=1 Tax=Neltuma alba TaxID=207710 RepID=UPI0010A2B04D|nr:uncharacterized protein LOC114716331 [Prosopis alba]
MELGSYSDHSKSTFSLADEDHTLANAVRFTLNQDLYVVSPCIPSPAPCPPDVVCCNNQIFRLFVALRFLPQFSAYNICYLCASIGDSAREVLKDACQDLMLMCQHVRSTFDKSVNDFKMSKNVKDMDIK